MQQEHNECAREQRTVQYKSNQEQQQIYSAVFQSVYGQVCKKQDKQKLMYADHENMACHCMFCSVCDATNKVDVWQSYQQCVAKISTM